MLLHQFSHTPTKVWLFIKKQAILYQVRMEKRNISFNGKRFTIYLRDDADKSVVAEIFKWREYRCAEATIQAATSSIVDVGAHSGLFTLYAHALNPTIQIISIEPETDNQKFFKRHIAENNILNVTLIPGALAVESGQRQLVVTTDSHNHFLAPIPSAALSQPTQPVTAYSFADLCTNYKLTQISLLKMDIEGGEYEILKSWTTQDFSRVNTLVLEYHDSATHTHATLEKILREHGFSVQKFPSQFDNNMGFLWARNKRIV